MNSSTRLKFILTASIALAGTISQAENPIDAQPIGLLDKKTYAGNNDQSDFYYLRGPKKNDTVAKVLFTAKVKTLKNGDVQRALFVQNIQGGPFGQSTYYLINSEAPIKKLATYTLKADEKLDSFIYSYNQEDEVKNHHARLYYHVPGKGLYVTEGGGAPKIIRPESSKDTSTKIISGAVRLPKAAPDGGDIFFQSRIFFAAKDAKKGREVFVSSGSASSTKLLKDINTASKTGSDPDQFCVSGPHNSDQQVFFTAKNPAAGDTYQLWSISNPSEVKKKPVYDAVLFTSGPTALTGKPENLVGGGFGIFFTAPPPTGGTPVLWHLPAGGSPNDLKWYPEVLNPADLTLPTNAGNVSFMTFSAQETVGGERYFVRWNSGGGSGSSVTFLKKVGSDPSTTTPLQIVNAGNSYNYFIGKYNGNNLTYLIKHGVASANDLQTVSVNGDFPINIREVCPVMSKTVQDEPVGSGGYVYFTGDLPNVGNGILMRIPSSSTDAEAEIVPISKDANTPVFGAVNLHAATDNGTPGFLRLYFSAPVSTTVNSDYFPTSGLPSTVTDLGTKPWVVGTN